MNLFIFIMCFTFRDGRQAWKRFSRYKTQVASGIKSNQNVTYWINF